MKPRTKMLIAFEKARDTAGGVPKLADQIGCSRANLYSLFSRGRPCPPALVLPVERATGISRHELRPDLYPIEA